MIGKNLSVKWLRLFILLILPILLILIGMIVPVLNAWYFILAISWFGLGLILLVSIEDV